MKARTSSSNKTILYIIGFVLFIAVVFLLFGGGFGMNGRMMHGSNSTGIYHLNWVQIFIGFGLGLLAAWAFLRKK